MSAMGRNQTFDRIVVNGWKADIQDKRPFGDELRLVTGQCILSDSAKGELRRLGDPAIARGSMEPEDSIQSVLLG